MSANDNRIKALAEFLELEADEIDEITEASYGDNTYEYGREEYLVLTDEEADKATEEYIRDSVWAFNASFIASEAGLYETEGMIVASGLIDMISAAQEKAEGANEGILAMIEGTCGLKSFVQAAISADGRGHFLAGYDGNENESGDYYIYRTN